MDYGIRFTEEAKAELTDIAEYIALDSLPNAKKFVSKLTQKIKTVLGVFPESGKIYKNEVRQISFYGYTAFYSVDKVREIVFILHILDLSKPLGQRGIELQ